LRGEKGERKILTHFVWLPKNTPPKPPPPPSTHTHPENGTWEEAKGRATEVADD